MDTPHSTQGAAAPPGESRWEPFLNWLALAMLLAGSVVWPR